MRMSRRWCCRGGVVRDINAHRSPRGWPLRAHQLLCSPLQGLQSSCRGSANLQGPHGPAASLQGDPPSVFCETSSTLCAEPHVRPCGRPPFCCVFYIAFGLCVCLVFFDFDFFYENCWFGTFMWLVVSCRFEIFRFCIFF